MGEAWWDTGRHGAGEVPESSTLGYTDSRKRVPLWAWLEHLKPQSPPQWHTSSNNATPTSARPHLLILPLPMSLWKPFSFEPPQSLWQRSTLKETWRGQTHLQTRCSVIYVSSEFSVLTSGTTQKQNVPCFILRSTARLEAWLSGHVCISYN